MTLTQSIQNAQTTDNPRPTWEELIALEPKLEDLRQRARACTRRYSRDGIWDNLFVHQFNRIIGWDRVADGPAVLMGYEGWEVAYRVIFDSLPGGPGRKRRR